MTVRGSCLCGAVRFQFEEAIGPFEICHCNRCRKLSGGQGMPCITVLSSGYEMTEGKSFVSVFEAPVLYQPPAYHSNFCSRCGSPLPDPEPSDDRLEIPAGLLDDDPGLSPDKHIFVEFLPTWDKLTDGLPQYNIEQLHRERHGKELPDGFVLRSHYDSETSDD